jgi:hypothetical protein
MGHALALCQCEPIEKPIERRAEDAAQIEEKRAWMGLLRDFGNVTGTSTHSVGLVVRVRGSKILH